MLRRALSLALLLTLAAGSVADEDNPRVLIITSAGKFTLELYPGKAPSTVENFLQYVRDGFYDGTVFHRVIDGFMIQGGGFTETMERKSTRGAIENEADNGLRNETGTIAMARTSNPHSATSQFFINVVDNAFLDHTEPTARGWGYTVFGRCVEGMGTIEKIKAVATTTRGPYQNVPVEPVVIKSAKVLSK